MKPDCCPNCGLMFSRLEDFSIGPLHISSEFGMVSWRGKIPRLTPLERTVVIALAAARGNFMRKYALIEAGGFDEVDHPEQQLNVLISKIRRAFREIDPAFDGIKTERGLGYRWVADAENLTQAA